MQEKIITPIAKELILLEIDKISGQLLAEIKNFKAFTATALQIPHILNEIGRLREITYREVGEGTGKSKDIDRYDGYCDHIFIWDTKLEQIVGAYRILNGKKIIEDKGYEGLYINTLFELDKALEPLLKCSLELGRSFIVKEYQKRPTPLFILWKALLFSILNSDARYLIGPVSISGDFSEEAKSITMHFLKKNYYLEEVAQYIHSRNPINITTPHCFIEEEFYKEVGQDFAKLDERISKYESDYHTPILIRQYISLLGTKVIGFNIDQNFNNCLDALMLMDLSQAPQKTIENLVKDYPDPTAIYRKLKDYEFRA